VTKSKYVFVMENVRIMVKEERKLIFADIMRELKDLAICVG